VHGLIEQGVADDVLVRLQSGQIPGQREIGDDRPQHQGGDERGHEQAGKYAQRPLGEKLPGVRRSLEALRYEKAADGKEHKDAGETEYRLVAS
jgi:hypothetical protein